MRGRWKKFWIGMPLLVALSGCGCAEEKTNGLQEDPSAISIDDEQSEMTKIARAIAEDAGEVRVVVSNGTKGSLFVFEEYHDSRVGQLQIGVMLLRLHDGHGLRTIGLEGDFQSPRPLDATWFHAAGGEDAGDAREDVAVRMLAEGEISAAEFAALVFDDIEVRGTELEEQYAHELDVEGTPLMTVLMGIAEKNLSQSQIREVNELASKGKHEEALEAVLDADPWVREQIESFENVAGSIEAAEQRIRDIRAKARQLGVHIDPEVEEGLEKSIHFYGIASERSVTMSEYVLELAKSTLDAPIAMIIGAGHSERVVEILRDNDVSFALLRPIDLHPDYANLTPEQFDRKNKRLWSRTSEGTLGRLLNAQRKPRTIIDTTTGKSYASVEMAAKLVAEGVRNGKQVPESVRIQLESLPALRVDWDSFSQDGYDVVFRVWAKDTNGEDREIWVRAGTTDSAEQAKTLEQKLFQQIADLGGHSNLTPRDPPEGTVATESEEGPGDGVRGSTVVSRLGRTVVVFAESQSKANEVVRLSG